jgi:hypothetical protein
MGEEEGRRSERRGRPRKRWKDEEKKRYSSAGREKMERVGGR